MAQWQALMRAAARELRLGGSIVFGSGASISLDGGCMVELTIQEGADGAIGPGDVLSASITLDLNNDSGQWRSGGSILGAQELIGATLMPRLGVRDGEDFLWRPLGVFQVESAVELEQQARLRLRGADSIAMELGEAFADTPQEYPATLAQLWQRAVAQTRYRFSGETPNGAAIVDAAPDWRGASLRGAMGCIAAAMSCFVRVGRDGALELCRAWDSQAQQRSIGPEQYLTLRMDAERYGPVDALRLCPMGNEGEAQMVYRTGESALYAISVSDNPLFQAGAAHLDSLAQGMLAQIAGYTGGAATFEWLGDPEVQVGARIALTDVRGRVFSGVLSRQTLRFSGGFRAECACVLPESADSGVRRAITPEGRLNAAALTGALNGAIISAGSVTTNKLAAGSITAEKIATGALDAIAIAAVRAKLGEITAQSLETNELATELARIVVLIAGTATFDAATIKHLVAEAMNLEYGVAGQVFIRNLAVECAQMIGATIGNLCIKSSDGKYYLLDVDADGGVTATEITVSDSEIEAGQTSGGNVIVETNMTAANLTTTNLLGTYALINKIDAARIDVDALLARSVFADALYTSAIYGGKSLKVWVDELSDADIHDGATPPETTGTGKKWLDRGVDPSQLRRWKGLTTTPLGNAMTTAREVEETAGGTSVSLDNSGEQINSVLSVSVRGKNLLDIYALCDGISYVQGGTIGKWPENGGFDLTATANDCYTEPWNGANYNIPVKPNTTYTLSWDIYIVPNTGTSAVMWFIDHRFEAGYYGQAFYDAHFVTFTTPSDAQTVSFRFGVQNEGESVGYTNLQLEEGDARTAFCAYKTAVTVTHGSVPYALTLSPTEHSASMELSPSSGINTISTDADSMNIDYSCSGWDTVNDTASLRRTADEAHALALSANTGILRFGEYMDIRGDGTHMRAMNTDNEMVLSSQGVEINVGGRNYSQFGAMYVQFGNYQLRRTNDGGLAFKLFEGQEA